MNAIPSPLPANLPKVGASPPPASDSAMDSPPFASFITTGLAPAVQPDTLARPDVDVLPVSSALAPRRDTWLQASLSNREDERRHSDIAGQPIPLPIQLSPVPLALPALRVDDQTGINTSQVPGPVRTGISGAMLWQDHGSPTRPVVVSADTTMSALSDATSTPQKLSTDTREAASTDAVNTQTPLQTTPVLSPMATQAGTTPPIMSIPFVSPTPAVSQPIGLTGAQPGVTPMAGPAPPATAAVTADTAITSQVSMDRPTRFRDREQETVSVSSLPVTTDGGIVNTPTANGPAAQASPTIATLPDAVVAASAQLLPGQATELQLRLHPPELGTVTVVLRKDQLGSLHATLIPAVQQTATILQTNAHQLQQALAPFSHQGAAQVTVSQQGFSDQSRQQGQTWQQPGLSASGTDSSPATITPVTARLRQVHSLIDYDA